MHTTLLQQVAGGNEKAFSRLFHEHKQMVYNVAWTYTEDKTLSEEILQDVFVIVWKNRDKLVGIEDFAAYIYVIAKNRALRVLKSARSKATSDISQLSRLSENPSIRLSEHQVQGLLQQALALLSPQQRRVFQLSRMEGLSREQVAEEMGISKATVSVHLTIALRLVRAFLVSHLELFIVFALFPEFF